MTEPWKTRRFDNRRRNSSSRSNQFDVIAGSETIQSVEVAWGTPAFPDPRRMARRYTIAVWSDPNGDGNPTDAVLLRSRLAGVVSKFKGPTRSSTPPCSPPVISDVELLRRRFLTDEQRTRAILRRHSTKPTRSIWIAAMSERRRRVDINNPEEQRSSSVLDRILRTSGQLAHSGHSYWQRERRLRLRRRPRTRRALVQWRL